MSMRTINIHEAKTHLSRLVEEVSAGEELTIAKAGKPLARLVPIKTPKQVRTPGFLKGKMRIASDFDAPLPSELLDAFEGKV
jgi:prevent-host-death family protein